MLFQQEFHLLWASLELFMALTHLFVFLGIRNSKLGFLRRQHNYFLLDGFTHLINLLLYSPKTVGLPLYGTWIFAFVVHMYYYRNLKMNPPPRRKQANRFSIMHSGKEMLETAIDVTAHSAGFYLAFRVIKSFWYRLAAVCLMFALFYRQMLSLKYFFTEPKMMPPQLQRFFAAFATNSVTN